MLEMITGLRMNHAYVRPGGVAQDMPEGGAEQIRAVLDAAAQASSTACRSCSSTTASGRTARAASATSTSPAAWRSASPARCCARPACRTTCASREPYFGYEQFDFDVPTADHVRRLRPLPHPPRGDQPVDADHPTRRSTGSSAGPGHGRRQEDRLAGAARPSAATAMGNSLDHIRHIMGESMEALIHHFKLVTEGFHVPAGQVYSVHRGAARRARRARRERRRHPSLPRALPRPVVQQPAGHGGDVRGRPGGRRHRRRGHRSTPSWVVSTGDASRRREHATATTGRDERERRHGTDGADPRRRGGARGSLPAEPLGAAADAAPRPVGGGHGDPRRHRAVRRRPRPHHRRGGRGRDLLHDVQAPQGRPLPRRRLHQHAVRRARRRRDLGRRCPSASASATTRSPPTARSRSSGSSARPPAPTRRS